MSWAVIRSADGVWLRGPLDVKPAAAAGEQVIVVATGYPDSCSWSPATRGFVAIETLAQAEATLLAGIDAAAAEERRKWLTVAAGQADEYRETWAEVQDFRSIASTLAQILTALALIGVSGQRARFPFLFAEADAAGVSLAEAVSRVEIARQVSREGRAAIKRKRRAAKIAVKAATTLVAKRAAANVNWSA